MTQDALLRERSARVVPGGMYGHLNVRNLPGYPQFMAGGQGARLWDVDGNEYIDFMCGWGPIVLGRRHPRVDRAITDSLARGDCLNGPAPVMVEIAELLVDTVAHADWCIFAKNGTDATTMCVTIARAATGRRKVLVATGAYHGAAPWCTPGPAGVVAEDRAHLVHYEYNDIESLKAAVARADDDLAAILVSPVRQDVGRDQEEPTPHFAREVRALASASDAVMVLDDVRCGFRLDIAGSWEPLGVRPDLSAWSKAIANGQPFAAVTGIDALRQAAASIYTTGSFWFAPTAMAAAVATITELRETDALPRMHRLAHAFRDGLAEQAVRYGLRIRQTGPAALPLVLFDDDPDAGIGTVWARECLRRGVYVHPTHNMFFSAAHTDQDIAHALEKTDEAFAAVRKLTTWG